MRTARLLLNNILTSLMTAASNCDSKPPTPHYKKIINLLPLLSDDQRQRYSQPWFAQAFELVISTIANSDYRKPLKFKHPLIATVAISNYCTHKCRVCYSNSFQTKNNQTISMEFMEQLATTPTPFIIITGGEPLDEPKINDLIAPLLKRGKGLYIATNGRVSAISKTLHMYPHQITILQSVWGRPKYHDAVKGLGSFERIIQNARDLKRYNNRLSLLYVLDGNNLNDIAVLDSLADQIPYHRIIITRKIGVGRRQNNPLQSSISIAEIKECVSRLAIPTKNITYDLPEAQGCIKTNWVANELFGIPPLTSCGAGNWMIHFDMNGNAYPCFAFQGRGKLDRIAAAEPTDNQWLNTTQLSAQLRDSSPGKHCIAESCRQ